MKNALMMGKYLDLVCNGMLFLSLFNLLMLPILMGYVDTPGAFVLIK